MKPDPKQENSTSFYLLLAAVLVVVSPLLFFASIAYAVEKIGNSTIWKRYSWLIAVYAVLVLISASVAALVEHHDVHQIAHSALYVLCFPFYIAYYVIPQLVVSWCRPGIEYLVLQCTVAWDLLATYLWTAWTVFYPWFLSVLQDLAEFLYSFAMALYDLRVQAVPYYLMLINQMKVYSALVMHQFNLIVKEMDEFWK